jgi:sulfite reductase alpha subunit-like flavoprotein
MSCGVTLLDGFSDQTLPDHLPPSATLRTIFTRYLDITAVPRYGFFEILHHFAENPLEKEKLQEFISPEGAVGSTKLSLIGRKSFTSL